MTLWERPRAREAREAVKFLGERGERGREIASLALVLSH